MKKLLAAAAILAMSVSVATSAMAANVTLYSLDNRTLEVEEAQVPEYTKEGMGWFLQKPVEMYAADGRTITVEAEQVEAYKKVGWFLKNTSAGTVKQTTPETATQTTPETVTQTTPAAETVKDVVNDLTAVDQKVSITLPGGPTISVPSYQIEMYKALGWVVGTGSGTSPSQEPSENTEKVTVYNEAGDAKTISSSELSKYINAGWSQTRPEGTYITVFNAEGKKQDILSAQAESLKSQGWYKAYDEAVYAYAAFGNGSDISGATQLLEAKKFEAAFEMVQDALDKLENTTSDYNSMLYYLRTQVVDGWRSAANSPLGFVNYWFADKDDKKLVVFEYRNVSNSRIQSFRINFDITDAAGNIVETNSGSYYVEKLEMTPCEKKRAAWVVKNGSVASGITNLRVTEVVYSDGTKWTNMSGSEK